VLAPLMKSMREQAKELIVQMMDTLASPSANYAERRGAAYGLAAIVKGLGISSLRENDLINQLETMCKSTEKGTKEGALLAFELLSRQLRMLFEPYIIKIIPLLLRAVSDNQEIRQAASGAAKAIMEQLSPAGVKLVLPNLLKALLDPAWRTKEAAIQLMGSMVHCAPRQLVSCLPQILPKLTEAFSDTHPKVREAGKEALENLASVVSNPEIAALSPVLLAAIMSPSGNTDKALDTLQATSFVHSVDAPSLALIVPILKRGLNERTADTKRKSALIAGNICSVVSDSASLVPYLKILTPALKKVLTDPIPDLRGIAAKSLGMLVSSLGERHFEGLVDWLGQTMQADTSPVERSGAAQGYAEVLVALGGETLQDAIRFNVSKTKHELPNVREGVLWFLAFLPGAMGRVFSEHLTALLPIILSGLADETDSVREVALKAGQVVVSTFAVSHTKLILPSLEVGIFDDFWRIRQSSVQLLGDFLYKISGVKSTASAQEIEDGEVDDDEEGGELGTVAGSELLEKVLDNLLSKSACVSLHYAYGPVHCRAQSRCGSVENDCH